MTSRILAIPSVRRGNGSGHLQRTLRLARQFPEEIALYLDREGKFDSRPAMDLERLKDPIVTEIGYEELISTPWRFILLDQRETSAEMLAVLSSLAPVAAIDEGGPRDLFDYLIDTLPRLDREEANLLCPSLNKQPRNRRPFPEPSNQQISAHSVLISFGGEDPLGLSIPTARALIEECGIRPEAVTIVRGPNFSSLTLPAEFAGMTLLNAPEDLIDRLADFDLLIGSYGLTVLEALTAGTPVVTINPSRYHEQLAERLGIPRAGRERVEPKRLKKHIENFTAVVAHSRQAARSLLQADETGSGPASIIALNPSTRFCPGCGGEKRQLLERFPERSFYRCRSCSLIFQQRWIPDTTEYNQAYFFEEYRRQYGKSYLEDYEHIKAMGGKRIKEIRRLVPAGRLLDIGCAYGPFLDAAAEAGYEIEGVEPAAEAARYAREHLSAPIATVGLEEFAAAGEQSFDVVTLWYVIEHFQGLEDTLRLLSGLVREGGVLAFGTPNGRGVSARRNRRRFLKQSPGDHYSILDPRSVRGLLAQHGFRVRHFRSTGLHRDRFPALLRPLWPLVRPMAAGMGSGDTFEIYAQKDSSSTGGR